MRTRQIAVGVLCFGLISGSSSSFASTTKKKAAPLKKGLASIEVSCDVISLLPTSIQKSPLSKLKQEQLDDALP